MRVILWLSLATILVLGAACEKFDNERPRVNYLALNGSDAVEQTHILGKTVDVRADFKDNMGLENVHVLIRSGFRHQKNEILVAGQTYHYSNVFTAESNKEKIQEIPVALNGGSLAGPYRIEAKCEDLAGNESRTKSYDLILTHPDMPLINVTTILPGLSGNTVYTTREGVMEFRGEVWDPNGVDLKIINIEVLSATENIFERAISVEGTGETFDLGELAPITLPGTTHPGEYKMMLTVTNENNHTGVKTFVLFVNN